MNLIARRQFLATLLAGLLLAAGAAPGHAKDGDSGGDGGGDSGHGGDGDGDGDSSGHGSGGDDGDDDGRDDDRDHDEDDGGQRRAREAAKGGNIRKLRDILQTVNGRYQGDVLDVRLRQRGKAYTYHVKLIDRQGRVFTVRIDAASRRILGVSGN